MAPNTQYFPEQKACTTVSFLAKVSGTTPNSGFWNSGSIFKIDPSRKETVLFSFRFGPDGCNPWQGLVMDEAEHLYGTTTGFGICGRGTLFELYSPGNFGVLQENLSGYYGHLTLDKAGNVYGSSSGPYKLSKN